MSLLKRKTSPYWMTELQVNGKRYRLSTKTESKKDAKAFEARLRASILAGTFGAEQTAKPTTKSRIPTVAEAVQAYYREEMEPRQHRPRTDASVRFHLSLLPKYFGADTPLDAIATGWVAEWRANMLGQGLKPSSVNRRMSDLRAILHRAVRYGILQTMPQFRACKLPAPKDRFLSDGEFKRLRPPHLQVLLTFLAGTGARLGEALELRWENVAQDGGAVTFVATKNGKTRTVPTTQEVRGLLQEVAQGGREGRVFRYDGRSYERPKTAWNKARARAGLPHVTLHGMRHYYCSRLVRRGVPLCTVGKLAGHSSPVMTARYAHLAPSDLAQAVAVLD